MMSWDPLWTEMKGIKQSPLALGSLQHTIRSTAWEPRGWDPATQSLRAGTDSPPCKKKKSGGERKREKGKQRDLC